MESLDKLLSFSFILEKNVFCKSCENFKLDKKKKKKKRRPLFLQDHPDRVFLDPNFFVLENIWPSLGTDIRKFAGTPHCLRTSISFGLNSMGDENRMRNHIVWDYYFLYLTFSLRDLAFFFHFFVFLDFYFLKI